MATWRGTCSADRGGRDKNNRRGTCRVVDADALVAAVDLPQRQRSLGLALVEESPDEEIKSKRNGKSHEFVRKDEVIRLCLQT